MGKTVLGIVLATVVMFVWGAVFWMSPLGQMAVSPPADDDIAQAAISTGFRESGAYFVPGDMEDASFAQRHVQGPLALVIVNREGGFEPMSPSLFAAGFIHELVYVIMLTVLLRMCLGSLPTYTHRAAFCFMVGLLGAVLIDAGSMVWWYAPGTYAILSMVYNTLAVTLAGLVLAAFVKPEIR